jgi:hypothetical protein
LSLDHALTDSCERIRYATTVNVYGDLERGVESSVVYRCRLEQVTGTEVTVNRSTQISNWVLYLPPDADVKASDTVKVSDTTYEVVGPPIAHKTPLTTTHIEAHLIHVS